MRKTGFDVPLGSIENAREAIKIERTYRYSKEYPQGWKKLGAGGTRTAFLGPDNVVYKIQHEWDDTSNRDEAIAARKWRGSKLLASQNVHVPRARNYRVEGQNVIAMEYIDGIDTKCSLYQWDDKSKCNCRTFGTPRICFSLLFDMLEEWGFNDAFYSNVLYTKDNKIWIIDLGYE